MSTESPFETGLELDAVVAAVSSSRKYREICAETVRRIAARELAAHHNVKAAAKATKRKLHQVSGAFDRKVDYDDAYERLEAAYRLGSDLEIEAACRHLLGLHSSTRERLPLLDRFYPAILAITGQPESLLDLGSGLNPLAWPWMGLAPGCQYIAMDIHAGRVRFVNRYLILAGSEPLARCQDVVARPPEDEADLALLLKMSPTLERQEPGATLRLIEQLYVPFVVVSFAVKSLGGREKGMAELYQQQFLGWIEARHWPVTRLAFETELIFVVNKP